MGTVTAPATRWTGVEHCCLEAEAALPLAGERSSKRAVVRAHRRSYPPGAMTLVLTLLTSDYAVQVSDRRLVAPDGSVFEDEENKGIFWQGVASLSYTGLARIGRKPTPEHCLDVMAEVSAGKLLIEFPAQMTGTSGLFVSRG
jgi:hypothetical protein